MPIELLLHSHIFMLTFRENGVVMTKELVRTL
jgi:hypothetical protein